MGDKVKKSFLNGVGWLLLGVSTIFLTVQAAGRAREYLTFVRPPFSVGIFFGLAALLGMAVYGISRRIGKTQASKKSSLKESALISSEFFVKKSYPMKPCSKLPRRLFEVAFWGLMGYLFTMRLAHLTLDSDLSLVKLAMVGNREIQDTVLPGLTDLYVKILSLLFSFLGNKETAVIYLQLVIQGITLVLLYLALRVFSGRITAYATGLLLVCSERWTEGVALFRPEVLYMFFWSLLLLILAVFCRRLMPADISPGVKRVGILAVGILSGMMIYFDLLGLLLMPAVIDLLCSTGKGNKIRTFLVNKLILLLGIGWSGLVLFFREAVIRSNLVGENFWLWLNQNSLADFPVFYPMFVIPAESALILAALAVGGGFLVLAFWRSGRPGTGVWISMVVLVCGLAPTFGIAVLNQSMWVTFVWAVLAGLGLQAVIEAGLSRGSRTVKAAGEETAEGFVMEIMGEAAVNQGVQESHDEEKEAVKEAVKDETAMQETAKTEIVKAGEGKVEEIKKEVKADEVKADEVKADGIKAGDTVVKAGFAAAITEMESAQAEVDRIKTESGKRETTETTETTTEITKTETTKIKTTPGASRYDTSTGTKYIDNPLPLPPKPVRKGLDYPRQIAAEKMHYDLEISDQDDFDL